MVCETEAASPSSFFFAGKSTSNSATGATVERSSGTNATWTTRATEEESQRPDAPSFFFSFFVTFSDSEPSTRRMDDKLHPWYPITGFFSSSSSVLFPSKVAVHSSSSNVRLSRPPATIEAVSKGDARLCCLLPRSSLHQPPQLPPPRSSAPACRPPATQIHLVAPPPPHRDLMLYPPAAAARSLPSLHKSSSPDAMVNDSRMAAGSASCVLLAAAADEDLLLRISMVSRSYLNQTSNSWVSKSDMILIFVSKSIHQFSFSNGSFPQIVMMPEEYTTCALLNPDKRTNT
ncbi:unnamed protein product [Linum trigynum]|uniref:Uncharacterized protein n=1 Tax=Linum trigynum TaxID=586398 RepID=A0AAV2G715_9ROSI